MGTIFRMCVDLDCSNILHSSCQRKGRQETARKKEAQNKNNKKRRDTNGTHRFASEHSKKKAWNEWIHVWKKRFSFVYLVCFDQLRLTFQVSVRLLELEFKNTTMDLAWWLFWLTVFAVIFWIISKWIALVLSHFLSFEVASVSPRSARGIVWSQEFVVFRSSCFCDDARWCQVASNSTFQIQTFLVAEQERESMLLLKRQTKTIRQRGGRLDVLCEKSKVQEEKLGKQS